MAPTRSPRASGRVRMEEFLRRDDDFGVVLVLILLTILSFSATAA